ncbi:MAG: pyridoxal phosphate-dependent aminotransferase [Woeseiaceae bacterium]|jgi:aspartate aminotransferase|nr:pyridoxal phosphate-dependent aminotransferase [Woeseiaceae bacterium]
MTAVSERMTRVMPSATSAVLNLAAKLREEGKDIISLGAGEPDFDTPIHIKEAAIKAIHDGYTKYTAIDGSADLKNAIQKKFNQDNNVHYLHEEILVSSGAKQTLFNLCMGLLSKGDEAIIPSPYWVSYPDMVRVADAKPVIIETQIENNFKITPDQLQASITKNTRLLFLNSPSNPTGSCYTKKELIALAEILIKHPDIIIAADDIYEKIYWGKSEFCSLVTAAPEIKNQTLTINGVSKCYAMTGWRIGYAGGPKPIINAMKTIQSQSTSNPCSISQIAAIAALNGDQACVNVMNTAYKERNNFLSENLNSIPGFICRKGEGAFYAFPKVSDAVSNYGLNDDIQLVDLILNEAGVVMVPGTPFGAPGYVRLSFACSMEELEDAIQRIKIVLT